MLCQSLSRDASTEKRSIVNQCTTFLYRSGGRIDKPGRGRGRGGRGGGRGGRGRGKKEPAPSAEDLDKELDTYLKAR